jgi:exportin-7
LLRTGPSRGPRRSNCATLPNWVLQALVQLLCRTAKLAWFDSDSAKALVEEAK